MGAGIESVRYPLPSLYQPLLRRAGEETEGACA
jgi:hypothetical protein